MLHYHVTDELSELDNQPVHLACIRALFETHFENVELTTQFFQRYAVNAHQLIVFRSL